MPSKTFKEFLEKRRIKYEERETAKGTMFLVEHCIPFGKYSRRTVSIGMLIPIDFPNIPPYGLHVKKNHNFDETIKNRNPSDLGDEWEFWSRETRWDNPERRTPQYYWDQVNRWLEVI